MLELLLQHLYLAGVSLLLALGIALPVGVFLARHARLRTPVLGILGVLYTVPSLALLAMLIPLFGLGRPPAIVALVMYSQLILVRNVLVGLQGVDPAAVEAARGMGMTGRQVLWEVALPLALPVMLAGVRVATVTVISLATVAAWINAGGLGRLLFDGIYSDNPDKIVAGTVAVGVLAVGSDLLFSRLERAARRRASG